MLRPLGEGLSTPEMQEGRDLEQETEGEGEDKPPDWGGVAGRDVLLLVHFSLHLSGNL